MKSLNYYADKLNSWKRPNPRPDYAIKKLKEAGLIWSRNKRMPRLFVNYKEKINQIEIKKGENK